MVAYHCDINAILIETFQTQEDRQRIPAYTRIMNRLKTRGHVIDQQVLDNESSKEYRRHVTNIWAATYQQVPPDIHRRNIAERVPSVGALVPYLHTAAGFPVKSTWLAAIKAGNSSTWTGLTYTNASRYCPSSEETVKCHLIQAKQGVRSTKIGPPYLPTLPNNGNKHTKSIKELHLWVKPISTLYTDDT